MKLFKSAVIGLAGLGVLLAGSTSVLAQQTVNWVHIETNESTVSVFEEIAADFEAANPGTNVVLRYIENEAFKATLPTMLQSNDPPHIFFSWGGGVLAEQVRGGVLKDITDYVDDEWRSWLEPSAMAAFVVDDRQFGIPIRTSMVGIFYNKALFEEAGVDAEAIQTWDDLMAAVEALKAAGQTPIAVGGAEGWPQHFWHSFLAARIAGHEKLNTALRGEGEGFNDPAFVESFQKLADLAALEPFQNGWLAASTVDSYATFGNGDAAMLLQGDWGRSGQRTNSISGEGIGDDLGWIPFPTLGGIGDGESFGGINGWIFFRDAPDEAVTLMRMFSEPDNLLKLSAYGTWLPPLTGIAEQIEDSWTAHVASVIAESDYHQNFYNVMFAEEVNRELLDIVTAVITGDYSAEEAADALQTAWEFSQ